MCGTEIEDDSHPIVEQADRGAQEAARDRIQDSAEARQFFDEGPHGPGFVPCTGYPGT